MGYSVVMADNPIPTFEKIMTNAYRTFSRNLLKARVRRA